ncbi:MAG: hypothetical protein PGN25_04195 [Methylorubrum populi]
MPDGIRTHSLQHGYAAIDVRSIDADHLLAGEAMGDAILAILCRDGTAPVRILRILARLDGLDQHAVERAYGRLLFLAELRGASDVVEREGKVMNIHVDLDNIRSVREHADTKIRLAMADMVAQLIADKFGDAVDIRDVRSRLGRFTTEAIREVGRKVSLGSGIDEAFDDELPVPAENRPGVR